MGTDITELAMTIIKGLVASGQVSEKRIDESYERILRMKHTLVANEGLP